MKIEDCKVGMQVVAGVNSALPKGTVVTIQRVEDGSIAFVERAFLYAPQNYEPLVIPEVPFKDLTEDQKIALVTAGIRGEALERKHKLEADWEDKSAHNGSSGVHYSEDFYYRFKPQKSQAEIRLEELEQQQRNLADEIAKVRKEL